MKPTKPLKDYYPGKVTIRLGDLVVTPLSESEFRLDEPLEVEIQFPDDWSFPPAPVPSMIHDGAFSYFEKLKQKISDSIVLDPDEKNISFCIFDRVDEEGDL